SAWRRPARALARGSTTASSSWAVRPAAPGSPRPLPCSRPGPRRERGCEVGLDPSLHAGNRLPRPDSPHSEDPPTMRIFVTGSIAYDYIMVFPGRFRDHIIPDKMHVLSVSFLVDTLKRRRGGAAANIAYNLALLGGRPSGVGTVGEDFAEDRQWLRCRGGATAATTRIPRGAT